MEKHEAVDSIVAPQTETKLGGTPMTRITFRKFIGSTAATTTIGTFNILIWPTHVADKCANDFDPGKLRAQSLTPERR